MIILITPTGGRPKQFELCMRWMKNQTYSGRVFWIVIDDCIPTTTDSLTDTFRDNWTIIKKYPVPSWSLGMNTQGRNLAVAINVIRHFPRSWVDAIFVIEDDDYYKPTYIEETLNRLGSYDLVGQGNTIYYDVNRLVYKNNFNKNHASLFQTCFTVNALDILETCLTNRFIDIEFFRRSINKFVFDGEPLSVGIKGLPGRAGIGIGHRMNNVTLDSDLRTLKELLGDDYKYYVQ